MRTIRILASIHTIPNNNHVTVFLFNNLLPILRKKVNVKLIWLVYEAEKLKLPKHIDSDITLVDIHDYDNAVEIMQKVKPDIVFDHEHPSLIDFCFDYAGKYLNIPVVLGLYKDLDYNVNFKQLIFAYLTKFFYRSIPTDKSKTQKKFLRRGRFFVFKYLFLLKTMAATNTNTLKIIKNFFIILKVTLSLKRPFIDSRFSTTLQWLPGEYFLKHFLKAGYDPSSLVLTGNPIYDIAFKKTQNFEPTSDGNGKIRILFLPMQMYEIGYWTRNERDFHLKEILKEICHNKEKMIVKVKLHPSAQLFYEYEPLIHSIDPSIQIYQKGNVLDYLEDVDVVVTYPAGSSAHMYALIAKKPIIICNFTKYGRSILLKRDLALECRKSEDLIESILKIIKSNPATEEKRELFIKEYLYKADGKASERLCDAIMKLLENKYHQ